MNTTGLSIGAQVLEARYTLKESLSISAERELWIAHDEFDAALLLKLWRYSGDRPDPVLRALWDRELRHLFRLSSAPQSETRLVVLRDAGVDIAHRCFVMLLAA